MSLLMGFSFYRLDGRSYDGKMKIADGTIWLFGIQIHELFIYGDPYGDHFM